MTSVAPDRALGRAHALAVSVLVIAGVFYAWLLTRGSFDPFGAEQFGLTFNSMLDHMLQGRWDVEPASIGAEAFVHDGRTYAYFGPFPALLRLPLALLPSDVLPNWQGLNVERLSCWFAVIGGIAAQVIAVTTALGTTTVPVKTQLTPPLVVLCALSGAPMLLSWRGALIYHEAILWGWALAMAFVAIALPAVKQERPASARRLCALAVCAGLCLLTRSTTGAGLYLATGLLLLRHLEWNGDWWRPVLQPPFWAPASVLAVFLAMAGIVNQGRWGNPLVFANLHTQTTLIDKFPDRLSRLEQYGLFDWHRVDIGTLYYMLPIWTEQLEHMLPLSQRLVRLYDAIEQPASSLLVTDPAWCVLSVLGVVALVRARALSGALLLAGGLSLAPVLMLAAWYLAFRYRVEFAPLLLVLSCIGLVNSTPGLAPRRLGRAKLALSVLCVLQVGGAVVAGWSYASQPFGPSAGYTAFSLHCAVAPASCTALSDGAGETDR